MDTEGRLGRLTRHNCQGREASTSPPTALEPGSCRPEGRRRGGLAGRPRPKTTAALLCDPAPQGPRAPCPTASGPRPRAWNARSIRG